MKRSLEEHAERFSEMAAEYDERQDSEAYAACASLVIDHADPGPGDVVLDLGCGTGAIALALAPSAGRVVGRDIAGGMLERAREKAEAGGHENVAFAAGSFREPGFEGPVDVVTSNFAMHHLADDEKREAIRVVSDLGPRTFVLGDVMFFAEPDPDHAIYDPEVDDPATVGMLADALTDAGFALTAVERVHDQVGVLVGERVGSVGDTGADDPEVTDG